MGPRLRSLVAGGASVCALLLAGARPADASSITLLVGDKDGFGIKSTFGLDISPTGEIPCVTSIIKAGIANPDPNDPTHPPCFAPILDMRDAAEQLATDGAHLTDTYSALYSGSEFDCDGTGQTCTLNSDTGTVVFTLAGPLSSATLTIAMGDFQSSIFGAMLANINGVPVPFAFDHGFRQTALEQIVLTPEMLAAVNLAGELRLFLDHRATWDPNTNVGSGTFDYVMFDYFELNAEPVPEPATLLLLATGLAAFAARHRRRSARK